MKRLLLLLIALGVLCGSAFAQIYVSQGGGTVSCGAAGSHPTESVATFNGSQTASATYNMCGVITTPLVAQADNIVIFFESNASLQIPNCGNGCIQLNGHAGGLIDGGGACGPATNCGASLGEYGIGTPSSDSGSIRQMNNGTPAATITNIACAGGVATVTGPAAFGYTLPNEPPLTISGNSVSAYNTSVMVTGDNETAKTFTFTPSGGCAGTGTGGSVGVICPSGSYCSGTAGTNMIDTATSGGSGWEIRNLQIGSYYIRVSLNDNYGSVTPPYNNNIYMQGCNGCVTTIHDNYMAAGSISYVPASSGDNGLVIYNNSLLGGGDEIVIAGSGSSNNIAGWTIHDNVFADQGIADTIGCGFHTDGIHAWALSGATATGEVFYNNWFTGNSGGCQTGAIFMEGNHSNVTLYNNVIDTMYTQANNGLMGVNGPGPFTLVNNTILGQNDGDICLQIGSPNTGPIVSRLENNIVAGCSTVVLVQASPSISNWDYNAYSTGGYNIGGTGENWIGGGWQSACSCDSHGQWQSALSGLNLGANGYQNSGSPVIGAGINLTSLLITALDSDTTLGDTRTSHARPGGSTAWDEGAYQFAGAIPPVNAPAAAIMASR